MGETLIQKDFLKLPLLQTLLMPMHHFDVGFMGLAYIHLFDLQILWAVIHQRELFASVGTPLSRT